MLENIEKRINKVEKLLNLSFDNLEILSEFAKNGVEFLSTDGVIISENVKIGKGTKIYPGTIIEGKTIIGENCEIGPNVRIIDSIIEDNCIINTSEIRNAKIDDNTKILSSKLTECEIMDNVNIGPYANIRPDSIIKSYAHIGDFVEIKNSTIGEYTSVSHLTYIGDSSVGKNVNIGCGCVTVNYSGTKKAGCVIEDNAFIGCHTVLVAPVKIGKGAYTASNTTVVEDIPPDALAIGRMRPEIKENWAVGRFKK